MQMQEYLEMQCSRIETALASHGVSARVWGGVVHPRYVRYQMTTPPGTRLAQVTGLSEEIALALSAPSVRVYRRDGAIQVEVPRREQKAVYLLPLCERVGREMPPHTCLLGLDEDGVPLLLRLCNDVSHVLITGMTGCGKTNLLKAMALTLAG
ncbi:MAG: DNA translocase FtsK, partial [Anaerolineae bacterium]|nr:DNA translocase FtsK [Anaerolineae bacterium]